MGAAVIGHSSQLGVLVVPPLLEVCREGGTVSTSSADQKIKCSVQGAHMYHPKCETSHWRIDSARSRTVKQVFDITIGSRLPRSARSRTVTLQCEVSHCGMRLCAAWVWDGVTVRVGTPICSQSGTCRLAVRSTVRGLALQKNWMLIVGRQQGVWACRFRGSIGNRAVPVRALALQVVFLL